MPKSLLSRFIAIAALSCLLIGCGFQLRGSGVAALEVERVQITGSEPELIDELTDTIKSIGVSVDNLEPEYVIDVLGEAVSRRAVATSGSITVSEYEVQLKAIFSITDVEGVPLIPASELQAQRVYSFDATSFIGNSEEEELLIEEMRQDIAGQLVRRFSATLRNQKRAEDGPA